MKKLKYIPEYLLMIIILSLFLNSCNNDNPVTSLSPDQLYDYDSARFDWDVDTLYGGGYYFGWPKDTNDVFVTNVFTNRLYRIRDHVATFTQYPQNIRLGVATGDESNNGFIVALELIGSLWQPYFAKFNGNGFVNIPNPQNLNRNFYFNAVKIKNENEMWIGANGFIVNFDGTNLSTYPLEDSTTKGLEFFYDENNQFKLLASIHHLDTDNTEFIIYQFNGTQWIKVFNDLEFTRPLKYNILNKYVSANNLYVIFELVDSVLVPKITMSPVVSEFSMGGFSFDNIMVPSTILVNEQIASLFHWNGSKWSLELSGFHLNPDTQVIMINENYYYVLSYDDLGFTFLMQGRKKLF